MKRETMGQLPVLYPERALGRQLGVNRITTFIFALIIGLLPVAGNRVMAQRKNLARKPAATTRHSTLKKSRQTQNRRAEPEVKLEPLPADPAAENADISITAHVRARSLKFDVVPNPTVTFFGQPARDTVWEAQRENLPTPVEPGVTYRDIGIRLKITSVFRDIDRIVAEALGEIPVTEDQAVAGQPADKPNATPKLVPPGSQTPARPPSKVRQ